MISIAPNPTTHMDEMTYGALAPFPPPEAYDLKIPDSPASKAYMMNLCHLEDELLELRSRVRNLSRTGKDATTNDVRGLATMRKLIATATEVLG